MAEKGIEGKNKIKERFNELAKQVTFDTSEFVQALLKKKEVRMLLPKLAIARYICLPLMICMCMCADA